MPGRACPACGRPGPRECRSLSARSLLAASSSGSRAMSRKLSNAVRSRQYVASPASRGPDRRQSTRTGCGHALRSTRRSADRPGARAGRPTGRCGCGRAPGRLVAASARHLESLRPAAAAGQLQPRIVKLGKQREGGADRLAGGQPAISRCATSERADQSQIIAIASAAAPSA